MINTAEIIANLQAESSFQPEDLLIVLGPTASGKTKLAVELAKHLDAEIISADSRQVYRGMNIGTGKDLQEYGDIPYHLIDIVDPGEKYHIAQFIEDFEEAYQVIRAKGKRVIVCGGTGFYLESLLKARPYTLVPIDKPYRELLEQKTKEEINFLLQKEVLPEDYIIDFSSRKRMIRALEVLKWLKFNSEVLLTPQALYKAYIIGLNPSVELRRERISKRLYARIEEGLIKEVEGLLAEGLSHEELEYYGLEYKYISYYLQGRMDYDEAINKLETEIHRYAKRQMTFFRKMERDGLKIHWL